MPQATVINRADLEPQLAKLIVDYRDSFLLSVFATESHQAYLDRLLTRDANLTQLKAYLAKHDQRFGLWRSLIELFWPTAQQRASLCLYELQRLSQDLVKSNVALDSLTERFSFIETQARRLSYWSRLRLPLQAWLNVFKLFFRSSSAPSVQAPVIVSISAEPTEASAALVPTNTVPSPPLPRVTSPAAPAVVSPLAVAVAANHYDYPHLQLNRGATDEQIKAAYRKAALRCHPDKPGGSHEAFTQLNQEYANICGLNEAEQTEYYTYATTVNYEELIKAFEQIAAEASKTTDMIRALRAELAKIVAERNEIRAIRAETSAANDRLEAGIAEIEAIRARKKERAARRAAKAAAAELDAGLVESKLNSSKAAPVAGMATSESEPIEPATLSFKL